MLMGPILYRGHLFSAQDLCLHSPADREYFEIVSKGMQALLVQFPSCDARMGVCARPLSKNPTSGELRWHYAGVLPVKTGEIDDTGLPAEQVIHIRNRVRLTTSSVLRELYDGGWLPESRRPADS